MPTWQQICFVLITKFKWIEGIDFSTTLPVKDTYGERMKSAGLKHLQILREVESLNFVNKMESSSYEKITVSKE